MRLVQTKTPLYAAFFCVLISACTADVSDRSAPPAACPAPTTAVAVVQGDGYASQLTGQRVTVQGIVTLLVDAEGFYLEEPGSDADARTSNAIFVQSGQMADAIEAGARVSVTGTVAETGDGRDTLTALTDAEPPVLCSSVNDLPLTAAALPLDGPGREALEGMHIRFDDALTVTDLYQFERGNFALSARGLQMVPTEIMTPGAAAANLFAENRAAALPVLLPAGVDIPGPMASGAAIGGATGVFAHDGRGKRLTLQSFSLFTAADMPAPVPASSGALRVVGMNLHNYFNGDGEGGGFPTPRGAETLQEFQHGRGRTGAAIGALDPHVIAVMELENDGFGPLSAAQDFIDLAGAATGHGWAVTRPAGDDTGSDAITVGIFYRSDKLKAIGPSETLAGAEFERSRQPQAQLFQLLPDGETLLIVVNHLKSKGSCPDAGADADQQDGQGCWNPMRRASAEKMAGWAKDVALSKGTENILILGDMNAYRKEDPIGAIRAAGFTELVERNPQTTYSFAFAGQHGTLDYAFASKALAEKAPLAVIWHVNAVFPDRVELPQPWMGFSDHDPVVVELRLRHSSTSD